MKTLDSYKKTTRTLDEIQKR